MLGNRKLKYFLSILVVVVLLLLYWRTGKTDVVFKPTQSESTGTPYQAEILWPKPGEQAAVGQGSGVAVNSKGEVFYLHRAGYAYNNQQVISQPTVFQLDADSGAVIAKWGADVFKSPHGLAIDHKDQVWITDVMTNKIYVFSPEGQLVRTYGSDYPFYMEAALQIRNVLPRLPVPMSATTFARPTDIVINENGEFTVSDGYRNKRIVKFDADGNVLWQLNQGGSGDGEFNLPHGIAEDAQGNLYVADRNNARIQVFSREGKWLHTWSHPEIGRPYALEIGPDQKLYVADGGDLLNGREDNPQSHLVQMSLDGQILNRWSSWGDEAGQLMIPHDVAVDRQGRVYVAELHNSRLQKFVPQ